MRKGEERERREVGIYINEEGKEEDTKEKIKENDMELRKITNSSTHTVWFLRVFLRI